MNVTIPNVIHVPKILLVLAGIGAVGMVLVILFVIWMMTVDWSK